MKRIFGSKKEAPPPPPLCSPETVVGELAAAGFEAEVVQETRLWDADAGRSRSMRSKEVANDYRYFPEPDLLPVEIDHSYIEKIAENLPELPDAKKARFQEQYQLSEYDATVLSASKAMAAYFEAVTEVAADAKLAANWVMGDLSSRLNKNDIEIEDCPVSAEHLGALISRIKDNTISGKIAKTVFDAMWAGEGSPDEIIEANGYKTVSDSGAITAMVEEVIKANPGQVEQYRSGKDKVFGFFVGQVMKASKGQADPGQVNQILKEKLKG